jgi:hypothetical protein
MKIMEVFSSSDIKLGDATQSSYDIDRDGNPIFRSIILIKGGGALWPEFERLHGQAQDNPCLLLLTDLLPQAAR